MSIEACDEQLYSDTALGRAFASMKKGEEEFWKGKGKEEKGKRKCQSGAIIIETLKFW